MFRLGPLLPSCLAASTLFQWASCLLLAFAQDKPKRGWVWTQKRPTVHVHFGALVRCVGDVDDDGMLDVLVAEPQRYDCRRGAAWVLSGRDGRMLHAIESESSDDGFGSDACPAGDVDRDGHGDWVVSAWRSRGSRGGYALLLSGKSGRVLRRFEGGADFGQRVCGNIDVNCDGIPDVAIGGAPADDGRGTGIVGAVFSGADGRELFALRRDAEAPSEEGEEPRIGGISALGDMDGDGRDDLVLAMTVLPGERFEVVVYSGDGGAVLQTIAIVLPRPINTWPNEPSLFVAGDLDADGALDVLVGLPSHSLRAHSLRTGALIREISARESEDTEEFARAVAVLDDIDGDHVRDLLVPFPTEGMVWGTIRCRSGATLQPLYTVSGLPLAAEPWHLGSSLDVVGDFDGDGFRDFVAGVDHYLSREPGCAFLVSGRDGAVLWEITRRTDEVTVVKLPRDASRRK